MSDSKRYTTITIPTEDAELVKKYLLQHQEVQSLAGFVRTLIHKYCNGRLRETAQSFLF